MKQGMVSIITPMYKGASFVGDAIESVQLQTYGDWEMIIVDDCSPDGGAGIEVVKRYASSDPRIRLIESAENRGSSGARNIALRAAQGSYVAFLDSDDIWPENYLQSQLDFLNASPSHIMVYASVQKIDEQTKKFISSPFPRQKKVNYHGALVMNPLCPSATVYDASKCPNKYFFKESLGSMRDDWVYFLDMLKDIPLAHYNPSVAILYRVRMESVTKQKFKIIPSHWKVLRNVEHLSFLKSVYCLAAWGIRGFVKFKVFEKIIKPNSITK